MNKEFILKYYGYDKLDPNDVKVDSHFRESWHKNGIKISVMYHGIYFKHFISDEFYSDIIKIERSNNISLISGDPFEETLPIPKWKVGDVCFFEYQLNYIDEMSDNNIVSCSDNNGGTFGADLSDRCFKITPISLQISQSIKSASERIFLKENSMNKLYRLHYPNIIDVLVNIWMKMMGSYSSPYSTELSGFVDMIENAIKEEKYDVKYNGEKMCYKVGKKLEVNNE